MFIKGSYYVYVVFIICVHMCLFVLLMFDDMR